jgi:biopolymer transport protein ExbB
VVSAPTPAGPLAVEPLPIQEPTPPIANVDTATLPHDLSPWNMFVSADIVVQVVMVGLVIASVITWTVWLAKTLELWVAQWRTRHGLAELRKETSLAAAVHDLGNRSVAGAFVAAASAELRLSGSSADKDGIKERVASRLDDLQITIARRMKSGTGLLATIGATAPFVGLFGTVWGIMNSFIGISKAQTTNLAVVAPGIAEALLATALGLAAAIPAVIIYNHFSRSIAGYRALVAETAAEVMRQLSRDLDKQTPSRLALAAE